MEAILNTSSEKSNDVIKAWFDKFLSSISVDRMLMETNTASPETDKIYTDLIYERYDEIHSMARSTSSFYFINKLVIDYLIELKSFKAIPQKLALDVSDAKILVWAQIKDNDELTEDALILSEARANSKYSDNGFFVSSTIVEESDSLDVPPHYHEIKIN
ncbi:MAG: hypothetical protein ACHQIM_01970 [Sphingobacteriales bacterium]